MGSIQKRPLPSKIAIASMSIALAACDGDGAVNRSTTRTASVEARTAPASLPRDVELPAGVVLAIGSVDDVTLDRPPAAPRSVVIKAHGTAFMGWRDARLEPMPDTTGDVSVMSFKFIGISGKALAGDGRIERLAAELSLDVLPDTVKRIRIVSATNELSVTIPN